MRIFEISLPSSQTVDSLNKVASPIYSLPPVGEPIKNLRSSNRSAKSGYE